MSQRVEKSFHVWQGRFVEASPVVEEAVVFLRSGKDAPTLVLRR